MVACFKKIFEIYIVVTALSQPFLIQIQAAENWVQALPGFVTMDLSPS